ncbi:TGF-beta-activated kinase 1 and MAP3K7-binding protein 2 [Pseudolycoriella hygida]|uniref:TGF-beta-activated kinase 1 and MAP3K7-binding protein 2 n=1 Tax=Pseudolycoriella hygida TaxID=35572 RepID=A0A9Q0NG78_9DIPT|nr:TGF-beta-activated kinase 1 and MAP3K7-binding protein 2 [Pseudolycoriella hygida]
MEHKFLCCVSVLNGKKERTACQQWMSMADNPPSFQPPNAIDYTTKVDGKPTCSCTKISNMHLFHEMKQEFATVPDHIVWQYVTNNCHNRPECITALKKEAESHPGSVQAYPQALRNSNKKPQRLSSSGLQGLSNNLSSSNESVEQSKSEVSFLSDSRSDMQVHTDDTNSLSNVNVPGRPNTLNICKLSDSYLRPTRSAPPPPSKSNPFFPQTPTTTEGESLNVSLNVTVSPVPNRPPVPPQRSVRHTTAISVQPEAPPFNRDSQNSPRSYTSVNFTLRQPTSAPQSPIDISAGPSPSLTYSSSSYDARKGYQSRLEITVGSNGSSISASRIRPTSFNTPGEGNDSSIASDPLSVDEGELVHSQLLAKQRLFIELENDKRRLELIRRELRVFQDNLPPGSSQRLQEEIERLRNNCSKMSQEVELAGPSLALGVTNPAFYQDIYEGQRLPRPQRPPPPHSQRSDNNDQTSNEDGLPWTCYMCTFQNHPLLDKCEQCEMPLLATSSSGNVQTNSRPAPTHRLQNISYQQQSAPAVLHNPFQYSQPIGLHPHRLTQTQQN